ncbi:RNase adapter RapZ [Vallicoccus soli]
MSGAGRTTAADALEDLGWYVVDNLPAALLPRLAHLGASTGGAVERIAAVVDVRSLSFTSDLRGSLDELRAELGVQPSVIFLEAADDVLVRRFESSRRPHPLQGNGRILDGITEERRLLAPVRELADLLIDTSALNVHQLATKVVENVDGGATAPLRATVMTFGYKYGLPVDADLVVDCRFLPNPHWVPDLRPLTGQDEPVSSYVLDQPGASEFLDRYTDVLRIVADGYRREGKRYVLLAVGCTGGKHRSVAMAEELSARLLAGGVDVTLVHRDLGRE